MWGIAPIIERVRRPKTSKIILKQLKEGQKKTFIKTVSEKIIEK